MKIAVFSDIHANLPAFEAFLKDAESRKPDAFYCLGDLVGYNVWPNEIIGEIRRRGIATLAGNHDVKPAPSDALDKNYAYHVISEEGRRYLESLPAHIRLEFRQQEAPLAILMVHGSPRSNDEYVLEDLPEEFVLELLNEANADVLFCGHSHKPYHRIIQTGGVAKHVINTGSVGKPKDGDPRGCYVLFSIDKDGLRVEFVRFEYDVEKAALAIEESPLPDELADRLRKAY